MSSSNVGTNRVKNEAYKVIEILSPYLTAALLQIQDK